MPEKTDAQKRAQKKYIGRIARLELTMPPEKKRCIKAHAAARGESVNAFINRAVDETMERDEKHAKEGGPDGLL